MYSYVRYSRWLDGYAMLERKEEREKKKKKKGLHLQVKAVGKPSEYQYNTRGKRGKK